MTRKTSLGDIPELIEPARDKSWFGPKASLTVAQPVKSESATANAIVFMVFPSSTKFTHVFAKTLPPLFFKISFLKVWQATTTTKATQPRPPICFCTAIQTVNFGQHFGQHWQINVQYRPESVATYGFAEGLNIGALPASGTTHTLQYRLGMPF